MQTGSLALIFCLVLWPFDSSGQQIDSLFNQANNSEKINDKIDALQTLSNIYFDQSKRDSAFMLAEEAHQLSKKEGVTVWQASTNYNLGYLYDLDGNLDQALSYYEKARSLYEQEGIRNEVATCMNSKGVAAYFQGDFDQAITYYLETLAYVELHDIKSVMANALNNLGVIYRITGKNEAARDIYFKTLTLSHTLKDTNMIATSYSNIGVAYSFDSIYEDALIHFDSALYYYKIIEDQFEIGRTQTAIGEMYLISGRLEKARPYLMQGSAMLNTGSGQEELSKTYLLLGRLERDSENYVKAIEYFQKGFQMIEQTDRNDVIMEYYLEIQENYARQGRKSEAYDYFTKYLKLYKRQQASEKIQAIEELQTKYETEEKNKEIAQQEVTILKSQRQRNLLISGILGLLLIGGFIYISLKRRQSYQEKLTEQSLQLQKEKIDKLEKEQKIIALDYMLMGEEKERKRIAKDLHDSLGALLTSARMQIQKIFQENKNLSTSAYSQTENIISDAAQEVRRISHDMMPDALVNLGLIAAVKDLTGKVNAGSQLKITLHHFDLVESEYTDQIKLGIYRIIQELVQNVIKHAHASHIIIQLSQEDHLLSLEMEDDGIGFEINNLETNKGMGLKNIESRVKYMNGRLEIDSKKGGPTVFRIDIPISQIVK